MTRQPMTSKRRYLSAILGGRVDRTPVGSPTSVATVEQMERLDAPFPDVHLDAVKMARLASGAVDILGYDAIMPVFSVVQEAAALGCEINWGGLEDMPAPKTILWESPEQVAIPDDFLQRPAIATVLEALRILRRQYPEVALIGKVMGPWTLAYHVYGLEPFLTDTLLAPDQAAEWLHHLQEITIRFGRAQVAAGADILCLADHATGDLVRATMYRDFLLPRHREIIPALGCPVVLHICGDTLDRIGYIADAGFDAFHFESKVAARDAVAAAGGRISLVGNVNNPELLLHGTPDEVARAAREAKRAGVRVLSPECAIPVLTPNANLIAIAEVVREG